MRALRVGTALMLDILTRLCEGRHGEGPGGAGAHGGDGESPEPVRTRPHRAQPVLTV
jgi:hypothetical protein